MVAAMKAQVVLMGPEWQEKEADSTLSIRRNFPSRTSRPSLLYCLDTR